MPHKRRTRVRRWVYNHLPLWFRRSDFEIFVSVLCLFASIPLLANKIDPTSLEATLPRALIIVWGAILFIGPIAVIGGIYLSNRSSQLEDQIFWRRIEAWGLSGLAYASYIYALIVITNAGSHAWIGALLIIAFGFTCHTREIDIQLKITDIRSEMGL